MRARLSDGALRGERVVVGNRQVWQVEASAAARYVAEHRGELAPAASVRPSAGGAGAGRSGSGAEGLVAENARLRAALAAVKAAHQAMLDQLTTS